MFNRNMNASSRPRSAWNLMLEKCQVTTAAASVTPVSNTTLPVNCMAVA